MKGFAITSKGIEHITALELKELIRCKNVVKEETVIKFSFKDLIDLCSVCYKAQSMFRAGLLLTEFTVEKTLKKSVNNIKTELEKIDLSNWIKTSFIVKCKRAGKHDFHSVDIAGKVANLIIKKHKNLKTEFDNPDLIFYLYIYNNKGYFGIDFSGFELAKRQYKIFNHPESLKGVTGYSLVKESGFTKDKILIDPFMGSGVIPIEATLYATKFPVQYYNKDKLFFTKFDFFKAFEKEFFKGHDSKIIKEKTNIFGYDFQLRYLKASQKNAKLAGIEKNLNLSKVSVDWLSTKFEKNSVDCIVTDPPRMSKHKNIPRLRNMYSEFLHQASIILKKDGVIVLLVKDKELLVEIAKKHKFKIAKSYLFNQGKEIFNMLKFTK